MKSIYTSIYLYSSLLSEMYCIQYCDIINSEYTLMHSTSIHIQDITAVQFNGCIDTQETIQGILVFILCNNCKNIFSI